MSDLTGIAGQFAFPGKIVSLVEYGSGNVNDTYLVASKEHGAAFRFILQRINSTVFPRPECIMHNLRILSDHALAKLAAAGDVSWKFPAIIPCRSGLDFYRDAQGGFWRALRFIADTECFSTIRDSGQAFEAGRALGFFHALIRDLPPHLLHDTLPGFHVTPSYLARYEEVAAAPPRPDPSEEALFCRNFIAERREMAGVLEEAKIRGELLPCPIHGDPKLTNILFDKKSGRAVSLIDLDTTKPGLLHYDIGDCLRSCCNSTGEDAPLEAVRFSLSHCAAILRGYLPQVAGFFSPYDHQYIFAAVRLLTFELGLRFFSDHLAGDLYFKTQYPGHNLRRACVQFLLCRSIEAQEAEIRAIVAEIAGHA